MSKQDRQGVRTAADLEQKYNFGKSFAEVMGIATDAQTAADNAQTAANNAQNTANNAISLIDILNKSLSQDEIFNRLTNNGANQGIYRDENGEIYINASYIKTGSIVADLIRSGILGSADGKIRINLDGGSMPVFNTGISTNGLNVRADEIGAADLFNIFLDTLTNGTKFISLSGKNAAGNKIFSLTESFAVNANGTPGNSNGVALRLRSANQNAANTVDIVATDDSSYLSVGNRLMLGVGVDGTSVLGVDKVNPGKKVLFDGCVAENGKFTVPNTSDYDLFAIQFGTQDAVYANTVLMYKKGDIVSGTGGYADANYNYMFFCSASISGDEWTLTGMSGQRTSRSDFTTGSSSGFYLRRVIGII